MGPNFLGKQLSVISKIVSRQRQQPSIKKVTIARLRTRQQSDVGLLTNVGIDYPFCKMNIQRPPSSFRMDMCSTFLEKSA
jgi:hypothetical protein